MPVPQPSPQPSRAKLAAAIESEAARTARHMTKARARSYAGRRRDLDAIAPGLSDAGPEALIAAGVRMLRAEAAAPRRWFGFGGEIGALNARALMLLGRTLRRFASSSPCDRPGGNALETGGCGGGPCS